LTNLVVGSIRDRAGAPIAGARILVLDARGAVLGGGTTDARGTFAVAVPAEAASVDVACRHCRRVRVRLGGADLAIVVTRYSALERTTPDAADLAALPYGRIADALALAPFELPSATGGVSDRGLGGGSALVVDAGAPIVDLATGVSPVVDVPDRYTQDVALIAAERAYRYGADAGGGTVALERPVDGDSFASIDTGPASSLALEPALGATHPSLGVSSDDGRLSRRADLDAAAPFAGGRLRAGFGAATESFAPNGSIARNIDSARLGYATASRRYRTFADASFARVDVDEGSAAAYYRSSYLAGSFRIEHPGQIALATGLTTSLESASYVARGPSGYALVGGVANEAAYVEASAGNERTGVDANLGLAHLAGTRTLEGAKRAGDRIAVLPSLTGRLSLPGGVSLRAGYASSSRTPTLLESDAAPLSLRGLDLERADLLESGVAYDSGARLRAEAVIYREFTRDFGQRLVSGVGASLAWQIAPLVSTRFWTLRDAARDDATFASTSAEAARQVLWTTYANGNGLRVDAVFHRDVTRATRAIALDGDVLLPFGGHVALATGTRFDGRRRYYIGVRAR